MRDIVYLEAVLREQALAPRGPELTVLQNQRKDVEGLLREKLGAYAPRIRYGGSKAKGTMIKEA